MVKRIVVLGAALLALAACGTPRPNPGLPYEGPSAPAKGYPWFNMYAPNPDPRYTAPPPAFEGGHAGYYVHPGSVPTAANAPAPVPAAAPAPAPVKPAASSNEPPPPAPAPQAEVTAAGPAKAVCHPVPTVNVYGRNTSTVCQHADGTWGFVPD